MPATADIPIPPTLFVTQAWRLVYQFLTQRRWSKCDEAEDRGFLRKPLWRNHWILVSGYVAMFVLIVVDLQWFQTDEIYAICHPQRWIGYLAFLALMFGASMALIGRYKQQAQMHRFSHLSDWVFPILLILTAVTGILVHILRYMGLPLPTYAMYVLHLAVLVPMLVLEVPFGKWSHLAYRPFAIYFQTIKEKARERVEAKEVAPSAT